MFSLFRSNQDKKLRHDADNWLRLAEKVYHYRRDLLSDRELQELVQTTTDLRETLKNKEVEGGKIKLAVDRLEEVIRRVGGSYYPKSALAENVEVLLIAAILAIGIRTYFIQPFKIPTNSMMPTYYGMTADVFVEPGDEPGVLRSGLRTLFFGARGIKIDAESRGVAELIFDVDSAGRPSGFHHRKVPDRTWFVFPTIKKEYTILVNGRPHAFRVPVDFQVESIFHEVFFPGYETLGHAVNDMRQRGRYRITGQNDRMYMETEREVAPGDRLLAFDILTGDQLFVDRMSYHFKRPSVGESFVFRTGDIPALSGPDGADSYYIKRLVGQEGDRLEVREPYLYRNGEPIDSREVFERIHEGEGKYDGYKALGLLEPGAEIEVNENAYFAMGDNSGNSLDSRNFGFVPAHAVVGKPIMIYYPFTSRWGRAR